MAPAPGVGSDVVVAAIDAGGMGEVFERDSRLRREVALKVLPEAVRRGPWRLTRFEQEARALAALNHRGSRRFSGGRSSRWRPA